MVSLLAALALAQDKPGQPQSHPQPQAKGEPPAQPSTGDAMLIEKARIEQKDGKVTVVYQVGPGAGTAIRPLLEQFKSPQGVIYENPVLNLLVVTDLKEHADKVAEILRATLTPEPQVRIDVQLVEVRWSKEFQLGFLGDRPNSALWLQSASQGTFFQEARINFRPEAALTTSPFVGSGFKFFYSDREFGTFSGVIESFLQRGRAKIKLNPSVWVKSGKEAVVKTGEEVPIPTTIFGPTGVVSSTISFKPISLELKVTPAVISRDFVALDISQDASVVSSRTQLDVGPPTGTIVVPSITTRSLKTSLVARSGEEVVIGGLRREDMNHVRRGLPLLMDIPILGYLFSREEEQEMSTEIIFMIKPTVYATSHDIPRTLLQPGK